MLQKQHVGRFKVISVVFFKHCITRQMDVFQRVVGTWQEPLLYVEVRDDR